MKEFVQYHKTDEMGDPYADGFRIVTGNSVAGLMDHVVWLIAGEGRPRNYSLVYRFVVDDTGMNTEPGGKKYYARGSEGLLFRPPIPMNDLPWWPEFLESQVHFRGGLCEIAPKYLEELNELMRTYTPPSAVPTLRSVTREQILDGIERFDTQLRGDPDRAKWREDRRNDYAILFEERWYPPKEVIVLGAGIPRDKFSGGKRAANQKLRQLGFTIITIRDENGSRYLYPDEGDRNEGVNSIMAPYEPSDRDARERTALTIRARRGGQAFRKALRKRYGDICLISGCTLLDVVEAAHIRPYRGENDNHVENGLLLRADLHTLFDLDLIGIEPDTLVVRVHPRAKAAGYDQFDGEKLRCVRGKNPSKKALRERWELFEAQLSR